MTVQEMKDRLKEKRYTYQHLSELSGVPLSTIQKIFSGATESPRYATLVQLERVLMPGKSVYDIPEGNAQRFEEPAAYAMNEYGIHGKRQGEFTLEDYLALPEDRRVELIDGVFYDMGAPTGYHQLTAGEIFFILLRQAKEQRSPCRPMISPIDVQLDKDDRTVVQPDVIGVCDFSNFQNGRYFGAPELIIEVLSPSTRKKDMTKKLAKYEAAGVREYWMIDLQEKRVLVNVFEDDIMMHIYGIQDDIPVHISNGKFHVDFGVIYEELLRCFPELG